jgi:thiol:disulfide interchange protein DsbD
MFKIIPFILLSACFQLWGQSHVDWSVSIDKSCKVLHVDAQFEEGWHIYSQYQDENAGPIPTSIVVEYGTQSVQKLAEPKPVVYYDKNFGGNVLYFEDQVRFKAALPDEYSGEVLTTVIYMMCNDEGCLPPVKKEFKLSI